MKNLTIENLISACQGDYYGPVDSAFLRREIAFVTTDSRQAGEGCLFAAICGSRVDGHDYIEAAFQAGALISLCQKRPANRSVPVVVVASTQEALQRLAAFYRAQFDIPVIGVTGSVGKTSTKEMLAAVLSRRYRVWKTEKNFNNELGVPLTLFGLRGEHEVAVVEMGISDFGEMSRLAQMVLPDMAVFTVIGSSHLETLGDRNGVLRAKGEMLRFMDDKAPIFLNGDDDKLRLLTCRQEKVYFGTGHNCAVYATDVRMRGTEGMTFRIHSDERVIDADIHAWGAHLIYAALAAAAVAIRLGLTDAEIAAGLADYVPVGSRGGVIRTDCFTILDDCYNSNPNSASSAVSSLAALPGRRVCILGDMRELGVQSEQLHRQLGRYAAQSGVDVIIACGKLAEQIYAGAHEKASAQQVWYFPNKQELFSTLPLLLQNGDTILVKASHGEQFGEIVQFLREQSV